MPTEIPKEIEDISATLKAHTEEIRKRVLRSHKIEEYPQIEKTKILDGIGFARSYTMQGVLKYHGMADWKLRTAFFSSVSINELKI